MTPVANSKVLLVRGLASASAAYATLQFDNKVRKGREQNEHSLSCRRASHILVTHIHTNRSLQRTKKSARGVECGVRANSRRDQTCPLHSRCDQTCPLHKSHLVFRVLVFRVRRYSRLGLEQKREDGSAAAVLGARQQRSPPILRRSTTGLQHNCVTSATRNNQDTQKTITRERGEKSNGGEDCNVIQ